MSEATALQNPNPKISAYYQMRSAHHGVITSDWQAQAHATVGIGQGVEDGSSEGHVPGAAGEGGRGKEFSVIDEFNG